MLEDLSGETCLKGAYGMGTEIHASAVVEEGAELGVDVQIGPFAYVATRTRIGDGTVIGPRATVLSYTTLGARCRLHSGAVIGDLPQDLAFGDEESYVEIGDDCVLREGVTVHRGTQPGTTTRTGHHCFLMVSAHLAHNVVLGNHVILAGGALLGGYAEAGDRVFVGGGAAVHQFVRIGEVAMLGGNAGVTRDVLPYCTVRSVDLNRAAGLNSVGMRRAGLSSVDRLQAKEAYRLLCRSQTNTGEAIAQLKQSFESGPARVMAEFAERSTRGIVKEKG
jgi:UDP-N-acetylglucosamine acyltransferase